MVLHAEADELVVFGWFRDAKLLHELLPAEAHGSIGILQGREHAYDLDELVIEGLVEGGAPLHDVDAGLVGRGSDSDLGERHVGAARTPASHSLMRGRAGE